MRIPFSEINIPGTAEYSLQVPSERTLRWMALAAILLLAAFLRFANFSAIGYGNTYYTAAVKSMLQSWHNFFFVAAEPGGSVSVDKPPVGFWIQAISAYFLGVNGFAVVLPQIIAGLLSVVVVYHLVRRSFGTIAGLLAALALAITPIVVATDRNNTIDSTLILTLLLAAWAFIKATETRKLRFLLLGATLVGIGFNIKMLEAYLPLPAFYAMYLLGSAEKLWHKFGKLALASVLLLVVSLSWAVAVDLTPASQRPYVGSSSTNSELNLALGYNGMERLLGIFGRRGSFSSNANSQPPGAFAGGGFPQRQNNGTNGGFFPGGPNGGTPGTNSSFQPRDGGGFFNTQGNRGGGPGGAFNIGQPGALRLFITPLSKEMSWLLPFGILSALLLTFRKRLRWPVVPEHQAVILWGGWLLTTAIFFSVAGFFHEYYLSTMAPPLAALVGIGVIGLWQLRQNRPWMAFSMLLLGAGATLAFQYYSAQSYTSNTWWLPLALILFMAGIALLAVDTFKRIPFMATGAFTCLVAAMLLTPGIWSGLTTFSSSNQTLPAAYGGESLRGGFPGGFNLPGGNDQNGLQVNQALLDYLQQNTQGMKYLMAVPSSHDGDGYILATGRPVLLMGGFSGSDPVVTGSDLADMVSGGQLRYVMLGGGMPGERNSSVSSWVTSNCQTVSIPGTSTSGSTDGFRRSFNSGGGTMYDCKSSS